MNAKMIDNNNNHRQSVDEHSRCSDCTIAINIIFFVAIIRRVRFFILAAAAAAVVFLVFPCRRVSIRVCVCVCGDRSG